MVSKKISQKGSIYLCKRLHIHAIYLRTHIIKHMIDGCLNHFQCLAMFLLIDVQKIMVIFFPGGLLPILRLQTQTGKLSACNPSRGSCFWWISGARGVLPA